MKLSNQKELNEGILFISNILSIVVMCSRVGHPEPADMRMYTMLAQCWASVTEAVKHWNGTGWTRRVYQRITDIATGALLAPAVTVGETEGVMDSTFVLFFTSSFAYNFARK